MTGRPQEEDAPHRSAAPAPDDDPAGDVPRHDGAPAAQPQPHALVAVATPSNAAPVATGASTRLAADRRMLEALVCPVTNAALDYDREAQELISRSALLAYPIRDGIPILLVSEARRLED